MVRIGLDVGSTTLKCVVIDENNKIIYKSYERHLSQVPQKFYELLSKLEEIIGHEIPMQIKVSGSAGMGIAEKLKIPFVQEVYATRLAVKKLLPSTDVVIELGGEDAKVLFLSGDMEVRMNGSCAGGTGAFIDQMSTLLGVTPTQMNELAQKHSKTYNIASRCGVFAKTDIQPLLNQGAKKEDVSASIFYAVVNQTIAGLAQGRDLKGNVVYLGGPLNFFSQLRVAFDKTLKLKGKAPENSLYYVALGTAFSKEDNGTVLISELKEQLLKQKGNDEYASCEPLFSSQEAYEKFAERHRIGNEITRYPLIGKSYIGVDAGSTTIKVVLINEKEQIVDYRYEKNGGTPVPLVREFLKELYEKYPNIEIAGFASTGYGEEIIKHAFHGDIGIVETIAHFTAAKKYNPKVDFIIDIGGQDIKCFKIRNGVIDNIFLNEACSSGCGSFLQTFAEALGQDIESFSNLGIFAKKPVDLGSRCTVFMNSSVKQAQKDGAQIDNISAGLSISVVKNALYKVIRATNADGLGKHIVVQGGTFLNDAVLRSFENEIQREVIRPEISGLMGAYGAALYVKHSKKQEKSSVLTLEELTAFTHDVKAVSCGLCSNKCKLTINIFQDGKKYISGNRCERPTNQGNAKIEYNMFAYKKELLLKYGSIQGKRESIGIPMGLNFYELLPFWHCFFKELGFGIQLSGESSRKIYVKGQHTIPSDTVCYPAKIIHGHIEQLIEDGVRTIFYPCMSYSLDEQLGDNHYNCPVVAYYPEVIRANVSNLKDHRFINDYVGIHRKKEFPEKIWNILNREFKDLTKKEVEQAAKKAYKEQALYQEQIKKKCMEFLEIAKKEKIPVIVLAGRPYHLDGEINHGVDKLICNQGAMVITEDGISHLGGKVRTNVLNQWTFHARIYAAAQYITNQKELNMNLVQLVSFGCGVDSITTDETRRILEEHNKIYTQLKIDEITNLGAVKIRLNSLFAATKE